MLLKFTKTSGTGAGSSSSTSSSSMAGTYIARGTGMRTTMSTMSTMSPRIHRKGFRTPSKRHPGKAFPGKLHSVSRVSFLQKTWKKFFYNFINHIGIAMKFMDLIHILIFLKHFKYSSSVLEQS
ncbi:uncharacterized protein LOC124419012 [Lucilia cuprina]|uniref:uncharacterized protein LOC124419012 n=1 Tax=Lucilia cuprina TaxID=7375 RepID=UPI001F053B39|nr:uncharacterized protein LOC124419012 [Lucilia cuprina]